MDRGWKQRVGAALNKPMIEVSQIARRVFENTQKSTNYEKIEDNNVQLEKKNKHKIYWLCFFVFVIALIVPYAGVLFQKFAQAEIV